MSDKKLEENLGGVLRFIIKNFGKNSLLDSTHLSAMISELRPNLTKESAWLKEALDLGIGEILLDKKNTNDLNRKIALIKARLIMEEKHIPKKRINFILENLKYGLKWPQYIKIKDKKIEKYILKGNLEQEEILEELYDTNQNSQMENNFSHNENNINSQDYQKDLLEDSQENDTSLSSTNKKHNYIIPLLIVVFIGIIGTAIFIGLNTSQVNVTEVIFDINYKKDRSVYVFKKGDFIIMNLALESDKEEKIDQNNLSYVVEDTSICKVSDEFDKCRITGIGVGTTTIHVYYGNQVIKNIDISFEN